MTHQDEGNYRGKHPSGTIPDSRLAKEVKIHSKDGTITCNAAHRIAETLGVPPIEVGKVIDLLETRLKRCQLGLYGYPEGRIAKKAENVPPDLARALQNALSDGRITCLESWRVAGEFGISKLDVCNACEGLGIKITKCQLGAFK